MFAEIARTLSDLTKVSNQHGNVLTNSLRKRGNEYEKGILKRMVEGSRNQSNQDGGPDGNRYNRHGSSHEPGELGSGGFGFMPCRDSLSAHVTRRPAGSNRIRGKYADM